MIIKTIWVSLQTKMVNSRDKIISQSNSNDTYFQLIFFYLSFSQEYELKNQSWFHLPVLITEKFSFMSYLLGNGMKWVMAVDTMISRSEKFPISICWMDDEKYFSLFRNVSCFKWWKFVRCNY